MTAVANVLGITAVAVAVIFCFIHITADAGSERENRAAAAIAACFTFISLTGLLDRNWFVAIFNAITAAVWWFIWSRNRRNRKRSPRSLGAKSRALIAGLVERSREALQPRPVLRPNLGGAS